VQLTWSRIFEVDTKVLCVCTSYLFFHAVYFFQLIHLATRSISFFGVRASALISQNTRVSVSMKNAQ
jgi:hypothetical protein